MLANPSCYYTAADLQQEYDKSSGHPIKVTTLTKITGKWLKWYGHVQRSEEGHTIMVRMLDAPLTSTRKDTDRKTGHQVERLV